MKVVSVSHTSGDLIPLLLDENGLPIPTPNEFVLSRRTLSHNTLTRNLRELSVFYRWLKKMKINFEDRISSLSFFTEAEVCGSMVESLRVEQDTPGKLGQKVVSPHTFNHRLMTVRQYLMWCIDVYIGSLPVAIAKNL
ncbi:hypothetical protein [Spartinivicinus poritis]|uniref:Uncharacterized protein n=1 Tax=Spartinivicinus poritis TaxID=2994640 RepID=A0ABT5UHI0_9GAMM|nr:hypothetical protein [Spartinivicinus sp. A2-2]MDE1465818.1 hypothetical protein [Spartinivicinus sp. A2-2]